MDVFFHMTFLSAHRSSRRRTAAIQPPATTHAQIVVVPTRSPPELLPNVTPTRSLGACSFKPGPCYGDGVGAILMDANTGKTVAEILKDKRASIKQAPLDRGSPSWNDILHLTWEEVVERAEQREPGFRTFRKLLRDGRFNK